MAQKKLAPTAARTRAVSRPTVQPPTEVELLARIEARLLEIRSVIITLAVSMDGRLRKLECQAAHARAQERVRPRPESREVAPDFVTRPEAAARRMKGGKS
jgi:hypothetical protein